MSLADIANEPAGRLRQVLAEVHSVTEQARLSDIWLLASQRLSPMNPDPISVRAEAAALFRAVEVAIAALPTEHEREAYRAYRTQWAGPILGLGISDDTNHMMTGSSLVGEEALRTLSMLSGTLAHSSPEPRPALADEELQDRLGAIHDALRQLRSELLAAGWLNRRAKARMLDLLNDAMDSVVYVRLRGFGALEHRVLAVEGELRASEAQIAVNPDSAPSAIQEDRLKRFQRWVQSSGQIVRDVRVLIEYDFVPLALGLSVGLGATHVTAALTAWIAGRVALEGRHAAPALGSADHAALPPGSESPPVIDSAGEDEDDSAS